jgi:hypothetical protein
MAAQAAPNKKAKTTICSTARHGIDHAGWKCMLQRSGKCRADLRQAGLGGGPLQRHPLARTNQVDGAQAEEERDGSQHFEIDDGFQTDPAHGLHTAGASDTVDQSAKDQGRDDGPDQAQKHIGQRGDPVGFADIRKYRAEHNAQNHRDKNPSCDRKPFHRSPHLSFCRSTSKKFIFGGRTRWTQFSDLRQTM